MKKIILGTILTTALSAGAALASERAWVSPVTSEPTSKPVVLMPEIGTLGAGATLNVPVNDKLSLGLGGNMFSYETSSEYSGIDYDIDLELKSFGVTLDYQPFSSGLTLSGGVRVNGNSASLAATPVGDIVIGDETYSSDDLASVNGEVKFQRYSPIVALGYQKTYKSGFSIGGKMGVMFHGSPEVSMSADGLLADDPSFRAELEKERQTIENELDSFKYYPVASFGVSWAF